HPWRNPPAAPLGTSFHNMTKHYESHKERHYEINPNSEPNQICCLHSSGTWTQRQRVRVVRRFPVRDGSGGCFRPESIPPDPTELSVCRRQRRHHGWPL